MRVLTLLAMPMRAGGIVILALTMALIATTDVGARPMATHIDEICDEHDHGSNTFDCYNVLTWDSSDPAEEWWGKGKSFTDDYVDDLFVRVTGVEQCNSATPVWHFSESRERDNAWIVSITGEGDLAPTCYPAAFLANYSWHTADDMDIHSGSIDKPHPNICCS